MSAPRLLWLVVVLVSFFMALFLTYNTWVDWRGDQANIGIITIKVKAPNSVSNLFISTRDFFKCP